MHLRKHLRMFEEQVVVVHEFAASLLVKGRFRKWNQEQTLDDFKNVLQIPLSRLPVLFECVDTNVTVAGCDVRVEYFG